MGRRKERIVEIEWLDSMSARGWRTANEVAEMFAEAPVMRSVGYLLKRSKTKIAIGGSLDGSSGNVNHYHEIPMSAVKSVRKIS